MSQEQETKIETQPENLKDENIVGDLNLLLYNIPENTTTLEKVRWLYMKTGQLFSYDYRVAENLEIIKKQPDFAKNVISRYETCAQISTIFNVMLNYIPGVEANVIKRRLDFRGHNHLGIEHVANEIKIDGKEKYLLDLTLDLYLIQSGFQTQHFGYETNADNDYEIIPLPDCKKMDEKLGILNPTGYKDEKEEEIIQTLLKKDYSRMSGKEILDYKIQYFSELLPPLKGHHEGKQLINKLIREIINTRYKEFNMTYVNGEDEQIITCFVIANQGEETWIIYSNTSGIVKTSRETIDKMLTNGWKTKSNTLNTLFEEEKTKFSTRT